MLPEGQTHPSITYVKEECEISSSWGADYYIYSGIFDEYVWAYEHYWDCAFIINSLCEINATICYAGGKNIV